jgi:lactase-phlorizin hydrolase
MWGEPRDNQSLADIEAAERFNQFGLGWFANPIYGNGDYPDVMKWQIGNKSLEQGLKHSRLPEFTDKEKQMIKGNTKAVTLAYIDLFGGLENILSTSDIHILFSNL